MHDVTNQAKKHHERFAKEKTDLLRWYDMSRNMVRILKKMARKICFNVQQKFDIFREFHEEVERKTSFTNNSFFDVFRKVSYGKKDEKVGRYGKMEGYFKIWL